MRFTDIDVNFDVRYEGHQNCPKIFSMNILRVFSDHHLWRQNWRQYLGTSLCQFNFFVNLLHSLGVSFFDIWHLFDNLTSFWQLDIFLIFWEQITHGPHCPYGPYPCTTLNMYPIAHVTHCPCGPYPLYPIPPVPLLPMCPIPPVGLIAYMPHTPCTPLPIWPIPLVPHTPCAPLSIGPISLYPIAHVAHTPCTPYPLCPYWPCAQYPCTPYTLCPHCP